MVLKRVKTNAFVRVDMLEMQPENVFKKTNVSSVVAIKFQK